MTFQIPAADGPRGLSERSRSRLQGVHPDLVKVIERAAEIGPPFIVVEGLRDKKRQQELVDRGRSQTKNSRHLTGHAVDLADVAAKYPPKTMLEIANAVKQASKDCDVPIEWGGDWKSFKDTPHFQLPWKKYPVSGTLATTIKEAATAVAKDPRLIATGGVTVGASNAETVSETVSALPAVPDQITQTIANGSAWQAIGDEAWKLVTWFGALPLWAQAPLVLSVGLVAAWPHIWPAKQPESD